MNPKEEAARKAAAGIAGARSGVLGEIASREGATGQSAIPVVAALHMPEPPVNFAGREFELDELRATLASHATHILALTGQGGVGKTALALTFANEIKAQFSDAHMYLDLLGTSDAPLTPAEAMARVINTFEPEARLPGREPLLAAKYRSVLEGKRALLLLDDARNVEQVKPLLPPRSCCALVTSRLHFANDLKTLPPMAAQELLLQIARRVGAEAPAIAYLCEYLPIALVVAGAALRERADLSPSQYRHELEREQSRAKLLSAENRTAEAAISLNYARFDAETQRHWRALSVFPETFDSAAAAAVWKCDTTSADATLASLSRFAMLQRDAHRQRYSLHHLMREFARRKMAADESNDIALLHSEYYRDLLRSADDLYLDGATSLTRARFILDQEHTNINEGRSWAATRIFADKKAASLCSSYPNVGSHCLAPRQIAGERIRWREDALAAARHLNDRGAERSHLGNLGSLYGNLGEYRRAIQCYERHLQIAREAGDRRGELQDLANLGHAYDALGEHGRAMEIFKQQLQLARALDDKRREAIALGSIGNACHSLGEYTNAVRYHEQALLLDRETGDWRGQSIALGNLGIAHYRLGQHTRALELYGQQLEIARGIHDRQSEGNALWNISLALDEVGERRRAIEYAEAALNIREEMGDPNAAKVRRRLEEWRQR
ncbi:MAG: tetratricopeptide repeat protein [Terriglobales bacterium]